MAFKKLINPRRSVVGKYDTPHLTISKNQIILNDKGRELIGDEFNYVLLYFDDETDSVGMWFWKERVVDSYGIAGGKKQKETNCIMINGKRFLEKFGIRKKVEEIGKDSYPLVRDEKNKDFYIAALKK